VEFFQRDSQLSSVPLEPSVSVGTLPRSTELEHAATCVFNRLGGLMGLVASDLGLEVSAVIAVWVAEGGNRLFVPKRAAIRFEVHQLFDGWGKRNRQLFDTHFRFGGHSLQPGHPWENQEFRTENPGPFTSVHHNQNSEYAALTLAQILSGDELALASCSIGGCQLMMNAYALLGFDSARQMYEAFQESERAHVLGFFDFCKNKPAPRIGDLINCLRIKDWTNFAKNYNCAEMAPIYAPRLENAYRAAAGLIAEKKAA
jgi:hypothetical protein